MAIETVRQAVGANVPIVVQGMNSMTEVLHCSWVETHVCVWYNVLLCFRC